MNPRSGVLIRALLGVLAILPASVQGQSGPPPLKPGDIFPPLAGQPLASKGLTLPPPASGGPVVVIVSFSRAGGHDAQNWAEHLSKDSPSLPIYSAIYLESVPRLFRSLAVSAIRSGMPATMQAKTLLVFAGQSEWKKRLQVTDDDHAVVVLLGPTGQIQSIISGPFSGALCQMIRDHVQTPP